MFAQISIVSLFAGLAAAQIHAAVGQPSGNPITRPLNEIVPACKAFTITWTPTTSNSVSVLLLKGPSSNVVKFGPSLAEGIPNSGKLVWTPASTLEATTTAQGYGLQIIDDVTGQYQYSTQFGISLADCAAVSSSAAAVSSVYKASSAADYAVSSTAAGYKASSAAGYPVASTSVYKVSSVVAPYPTNKASTLVYTTGAPGNATVIKPTGSLTVPSSLRPSATSNTTTSSIVEATGAASALQAGLSFAGAAAALAFML